MVKKRGMIEKNFTKEPIMFPHLVVPNGFLDEYMETHALWYYYLCARKTWENKIDNPIVLEGDDDPTVNFRGLFETIAFLYSVRTEHMANCWQQIDMQCTALNMPKLPDEERYRFAATKRIIS